jgi:hypothetical protein
VFDNEIHFHYLVWTFAMLALLLCLNLVRSGVGRGLAALAEDETAAAALGVDTRGAKVKVFILSAVLASVAGSLFAHCYAFVSPDSFNIFVSVDFVIMVVVGGMGSIWGTLFGTALITLLPEWIEALESFKDIVHGLILVLILLFLPQGLVTGLSMRCDAVALHPDRGRLRKRFPTGKESSCLNCRRSVNGSAACRPCRMSRFRFRNRGGSRPSSAPTGPANPP